MNLLLAKEKIKDFLLEDIGNSDLSTDLVFKDSDIGNGVFIAKEEGIISGMAIPQIVYNLLGGNVEFSPLKSDGDVVKVGDTIASVSGSIKTLLTGERVILNLMQRMSGIATVTSKAVKTLDDPNIRVCDTRKTAPGLRIFDKHAVTSGGGYNHRIGLYDGVMLKDNHISYSGGISQAVSEVRKKVGHMVKIEVEIETLDQLKEAVSAGADIIMFDNRTPEEVKEFTKYVPSHITTEISGGINIQNINSYKGTNADYISLGYLTHSVKALDISFNNSEGEKVWKI